MYQDHVCTPPCNGPTIGHVVSRDFVHWASLPTSLWNDKPYDRDAIYTGSASVIKQPDGTSRPFLIYPGKCNKVDFPNNTANGARDGCITGANYVQAVPADPADPLLTVWTKDRAEGIDIAVNPIVNGTGDDPSTAWLTKYGEYRLIGNSYAYGQANNQVAPIFAAANYFTGAWHLVGETTLPSGECPSLFPLPQLYPGTTAGTGELPTHVHKRGHDRHNKHNTSNDCLPWCSRCHGDCMALGTWADGTHSDSESTRNSRLGVTIPDHRSSAVVTCRRPWGGRHVDANAGCSLC